MERPESPASSERGFDSSPIRDVASSPIHDPISSPLRYESSGSSSPEAAEGSDVAFNKRRKYEVFEPAVSIPAIF